ncbi:alpha-L-fucosidase [Streptomyces phyllanthi]|uniref:alpha-L-fucosidase n=1 Tax=Streptomyces phyllanthi TaxID=1803180 RepID=A0A5N8W390_9ACTN|nr:alpha-L-fucosidase [Streptomyces phyllanthi]MPY41749.1 alpha-L-fucosidase [Streptomyces phyllanthi]
MSALNRRSFLTSAVAVSAALTLGGALDSLPAYAAAPANRPGRAWLRDARIGLFLHWGMRTVPEYTDVEAWEARVTGDGWSAGYWVDEAIKLHASYLVLASFHSRLGYARTWPSRIPGSPRTQRDFLGELIAAAKDKGLKVVLYMTDDPQWHNESGFEYLDSAAYSAHKGQSVDLTTRDGFGMFSYDNFVEVMADYPDLAGFWIDNDNAYWEQSGLYERIRRERPEMTLSNNNEDTPIMDMVSHEQKSGMLPDYDYAAATWTPLPRLAEGCFTTAGRWWYNGTDNTVNEALTLRRIISNCGASIRSLVAEGAQHGGRFPARTEAFNNAAKTWLDGVWGSLRGTEGGGYLYGGLQPGRLPDDGFVTVTVDRDDPTTQYLHITTRPSGDTVEVRDNAHTVRRVEDFRTGRRLAFEQRDGCLTVSGITRWDPYDTVLKIRTAPRRTVLIPPDGITATATSSASGFPAANLVDGDFTTYWDAGDTIPVSVTLDVGRVRHLAYLALNQREWSPTQNRETFGRKEDSARIKDYRVFTSDDGVTWSQEPVAAGVLESAKGVRFIDLGVRCRYARLDVDSTWAAETVPAFYRKLRIDHVGVATHHPRGGGRG